MKSVAFHLRCQCLDRKSVASSVVLSMTFNVRGRRLDRNPEGPNTYYLIEYLGLC